MAIRKGGCPGRKDAGPHVYVPVKGKPGTKKCKYCPSVIKTG